MEKSTEIKDEESCVEKDIGILKTRAKEYEKELNQVLPTPMSKSNKKPQIIVFMKCIDHVGSSSNLCGLMTHNVQCCHA